MRRDHEKAARELSFAGTLIKLHKPDEVSQLYSAVGHEWGCSAKQNLRSTLRGIVRAGHPFRLHFAGSSMTLKPDPSKRPSFSELRSARYFLRCAATHADNLSISTASHDGAKTSIVSWRNQLQSCGDLTMGLGSVLKE